MPNLVKLASGSEYLLQGNEAIARGALEAGVQYCAAYPGTPSTEILTNLAAMAKEAGATILRGGKEAISSNQAITLCIQGGLRSAGLPEHAVQVINTTDRAAVGLLLGMS